MADKSLYQLPSASDVGLTDLIYLEQVDEHAEEGFVTKNVQAAILGETIVSEFQYSSSGLVTEDKTIVGAINEIAESGGSASAFIIEVTQSGQSYSIDKTAAEIDAAYSDGAAMFANLVYSNFARICELSITESGTGYVRYTFQNTWSTGFIQILIITHGGTVEVSVTNASIPSINDNFVSSSYLWSSKKTKEYTDDAIVSILPTDTASGTIVTFETSLALPLVECKAQIVPTQSGTGDPSPSNVRPISGWTSCNVTRAGANIWDEQWESGSFNNSGEPVADSTRIRTINFISIRPNTTYFAVSSVTLAFRFYDKNHDFISGGSQTKNTTFTTPTNAAYLKFAIVQTTTYGNDVSINYPSTDTTYHAYGDGDTYEIDLDGTVYGGELDVKRGVLKVTHVLRTYEGSENWSVISSGESKRFTLSVSDCDTSETPISDTFTSLAQNTGPFGTFWFAQDILRIPDGEGEFETLTAFKTWLSENTPAFRFKLKTPTEVTLTPEEITTLSTNNIWADTGNIEVEYKVSIKEYIDNKLAEMSGNRSVTLNKTASLDVEKTEKTEEKEDESDER